MTEIVGWASATVLLLTLARQVYVQSRTDSVAGVSKWLFRGQIAASIGFIVYSALVENWVFVVTNTLILVTAIFGQWLYWHRTHRAGAARSSARQVDGESGRP